MTMPKKYKYFTPEEDALIRENFPTMQNNVHTLFPDRSSSCVISRAKLLGLVAEHRPPARMWTKEEDEILKSNYPTMGGKVIELLPNRTPGAIKGRIKTLRLRKPTNWTPAEDLIIRHHGFEYSEELIELLPDRDKNEIKERVLTLKNRRLGEIQYPLNLYIAVYGSYEGYFNMRMAFEFMIDNIRHGIKNNTINPEIGEKIVTAINLRYEEYMDYKEMAYKMNITEAQAEDLVKRGLKVMKYYLPKKKEEVNKT